MSPPKCGVSCSEQFLLRRHAGHTELFSHISGEPGLAQATFGADEHPIKGLSPCGGPRPSSPRLHVCRCAWGSERLLPRRAKKQTLLGLTFMAINKRQPQNVLLILSKAGCLLCFLLCLPCGPEYQSPRFVLYRTKTIGILNGLFQLTLGPSLAWLTVRPTSPAHTP